MSFNLIDAAKDLFTNELTGKASTYLGESETNVSKAIDGIIPIVISGLINKVATNEGAATVAKMVNEQHNSGVLDNLDNFFNANSGILLNRGMGLLTGLFGHKLDGITALISNFAGIKPSSASSLLSMALPAILGLLGQHINATDDGIAGVLNNQKDSVAAALPAGLNLNSVLNNVENKVSDIDTTIRSNKTYDAAEKESGSGLRILLPVLLLACGVVLAWYLLGKGCNKGADVIADTEDTIKAKNEHVIAVAGKLDSLTGDWIYDAGEMVSIALPNNVGDLIVGKNSTEYKLVHFLNDTTAPVDTVKGTWFEFTNVHFKKGGAELTNTSMEQLDNMVRIAIAYPNARFKFGGYTDNTGTDEINIPLSQKRADTVAVMVIELGAPKENIAGAEGYGSQWPIQSNDTKEGQAQNRRVAVRVKAK